VKRDYRQAALGAKTRALLDYCVKLTATPGEMTKGDVDALRAAGWNDQAIHDAAQVVGAFNYYNRLADGLGIDLEPEMSLKGNTRGTTETQASEGKTTEHKRNTPEHKGSTAEPRENTRGTTETQGDDRDANERKPGRKKSARGTR